MTLFRRDLQERAVSTADSREFIQRFATKIKRLNRHTNQRRLLIRLVAYMLLMNLVSLGVFTLAATPINEAIASAADILATPVAILCLSEWILQRKIFT